MSARGNSQSWPVGRKILTGLPAERAVPLSPPKRSATKVKRFTTKLAVEQCYESHRVLSKLQTSPLWGNGRHFRRFLRSPRWKLTICDQFEKVFRPLWPVKACRNKHCQPAACALLALHLVISYAKPRRRGRSVVPLRKAWPRRSVCRLLCRHTRSTSSDDR